MNNTGDCVEKLAVSFVKIGISPASAAMLTMLSRGVNEYVELVAEPSVDARWPRTRARVARVMRACH